MATIYKYKESDLTKAQWTLFKAGGGQSAIADGKSLSTVINDGRKALGIAKPANNIKRRETNRQRQTRLRSSGKPKIGDIRQ